MTSAELVSGDNRCELALNGALLEPDMAERFTERVKAWRPPKPGAGPIVTVGLDGRNAPGGAPMADTATEPGAPPRVPDLPATGCGFKKPSGTPRAFRSTESPSFKAAEQKVRLGLGAACYPLEVKLSDGTSQIWAAIAAVHQPEEITALADELNKALAWCKHAGASNHATGSESSSPAN